jgi:hypothetical protein
MHPEHVEVNNRSSHLTFACIKGHFSIRSNEEVDRAVKLQAEFPEIVSIRPSVATQKRLDKHAKKMWQRQWSSPKATTSKFYVKNFSTALLCPAFFRELRAEQVSLSKIRLDKLNLYHKLFNKETCTNGKNKEKTHTRVYFRKREKKYPWLPSKFPNQRNPKRFTFIREFCFSDRVAVLS